MILPKKSQASVPCPAMSVPSESLTKADCSSHKSLKETNKHILCVFDIRVGKLDIGMSILKNLGPKAGCSSQRTLKEMDIESSQVFRAWL